MTEDGGLTNMPEFEGTSNKSSFDEALGIALQKALKSSSQTDSMVSYTVKKIHGRKGGIAGFSELTVVIEVAPH